MNTLLGLPDDDKSNLCNIVSGIVRFVMSFSVMFIHVSALDNMPLSIKPCLISRAALNEWCPYGLSLIVDMIFFTFPTDLFILSSMFLLFLPLLCHPGYWNTILTQASLWLPLPEQPLEMINDMLYFQFYCKNETTANTIRQKPSFPML